MTIEIALELLPEERAALLQWNFTPEIQEQLESLASSRKVETIKVPRSLISWLESDLNHAIVKKGCHDEVVADLSYRLEYVGRTGDGSLAGW